MKKMGFLLIGIMMVSMTSYSATSKLEDSLNSIENQYNEKLEYIKPGHLYDVFREHKDIFG